MIRLEHLATVAGAAAIALALPTLALAAPAMPGSVRAVMSRNMKAGR